MSNGRTALVSIRYTAGFRDLTAAKMANLHKPQGPKVESGEGDDGMPKGLVRNRKLAERLEKKKADASNAAAANIDPKKGAGGKGAPAPAQPAKGADPKAAAQKEIIVPKGKTKEQVIAEMEAEEEKKRQEAEEAERARLAELEKGFDKHAELDRYGGKVYDFFPEDNVRKSQHYEWLIPVYYKSAEKEHDEVKVFYLEARTTTVFRSLVPNVKELEFGEIPVANRRVLEILVKNVGELEESMRMEPLTPFGGFSVLNAMRTLLPGETKPIVVQFEPHAQQIFEERLMIYSNHTVVSVNLKGTGVRPEVEIIGIPEGLLNFGNIMHNEYVEKNFTVKNISGFPVTFSLESMVNGVGNKLKMTPFTLVP